MEPLADGEYDAIVMGTGLKECVISGLLSVKGKKVLQVDRNGYYGGDGASLNLTTLFEKFQAGEPPENFGTVSFVVVLFGVVVVCLQTLAKNALNLFSPFQKKYTGANRDYNVDLIPKVRFVRRQSLLSLVSHFPPWRFPSALFTLTELCARPQHMYSNNDEMKTQMHTLSSYMHADF